MLKSQESGQTSGCILVMAVVFYSVADPRVVALVPTIIFLSSLGQKSCVSKMHPSFTIIFFAAIISGFPDVGDSCVYDGTNFLLVMPQVFPYNQQRNYTVSIHGKSNTQVTIEGPWSGKEEHVIGEETFINMTSVHHTQLKAVFENGDAVQDIGFRIRSTSRVVVYVHTEEGDGYTAIPRRWDNTTYDFITASYTVRSGCHSYIAVAAFETDTLVEVTIRVENGTANIGNRVYENQQSFSAAVDRGKVLFIWSLQDLTGTFISGNKAISVFSGADCACVPVGSDRCQGMMEQFLPAEKLGTISMSVPLFGRSDNTIYRAVAANSGTSFRAHNVAESTLLDKVGDYKEWEMTGQFGRIIRSKGKLLLVQYHQGGCNPVSWPSMNLVVPNKSQRKQFRIAAMADYETTLIIIHPVSESGNYSIIINNNLTDAFDVNKVNKKFVALKATVTEGAYNIRSSDGNADIMVYVYGFGKTSSYSLIGACFVNQDEVSTSVPEATTQETSKPDQISYGFYESDQQISSINTIASAVPIFNSLTKSFQSIPSIVSLQEATRELLSVLYTVSKDYVAPDTSDDIISLRARLTTSSAGAEVHEELSMHTDMESTLVCSDAKRCYTSVPSTDLIYPSTYGTAMASGRVAWTTSRVTIDTSDLPAVRKSDTSVTSIPVFGSYDEMVTQTMFDREATTKSFHDKLMEPMSSADTIMKPWNLHQSSMLETEIIIHDIVESASTGSYSSTDEYTIHPVFSDATAKTDENVATEHFIFKITEPFNSTDTRMERSSVFQASMLDIESTVGNGVTSHLGSSNSDKGKSWIPSVYSLCPCPSKINNNQVIFSRIEARKSDLTMNSKTLTLQIQKRQCTEDARASSKSFGIIGILVVVLPVSCVIVEDIMVVLKHVVKR